MTKGKAVSTRVRIIDCAVELYKTREYTSVTVNDICSSCGLTRSAFYYHFNSKDEVLDEYFLYTDLYILNRLTPLLPQYSATAQIEHLLSLYMQRAVESGVSVLSTLFHRSLISGKVFSFPHNTAVCDLLLSLIARGQAEGLIRNSSSPTHLLHGIIHLNASLALTWCTKNGKWDIMTEYRSLLQALLMFEPSEHPVIPELPPIRKKRVQGRIK
ncbi:MAG: TetR/AcrR family transcriptional regulator [Oscillospiraceae bacterium]|nr:TetR/AcrR family transcriptional regulator [Oscillospiraceae bacterium]